MAEVEEAAKQVVVSDVPPQPEKPAEKVPNPEPEEEEEKKDNVEETVTLGTHLSKHTDSSDNNNNNGDDKNPETVVSKEESTNLSSDKTLENENKALHELKNLIQEALNKHEFSTPAKPPPTVAAEEKEKPLEKEGSEPVAEKTEEPVAEKTEEHVAEKTEETGEKKEEEKGEGEGEVEKKEEVEEAEVASAAAPSVDDDGAKTVEAIEETVVAVSSSSVSSVLAEQQGETEKVAEAEAKDEASLTLSPPEEVSIWGIPLLADERSDLILLKFLRARDFKVKEAFTMIQNTIRWRKEFKMDELLEEKLGDELEKVVYMQGFDKEGHPVCYNIYGEFQDKELYKKAFSDEEKRQNFLRWRIQFLEKSIRKLDFNPGGICTIVQVNDLKNSPGPGKWELRQATNQALQLFQDNYPEFVFKQVFINVPWWYLAVNRMISPFLTQRTKSKFVFAGPSKSVETLLRYIAPEQLPVKYGGLSKDGEFENSEAVTEITIRPAAKHTVEFPVTEKCLLSWELRVIGWDISYGAEFVPSSEGSYTVIVQKDRKVASSEEPVLFNSFKIEEPGKVVLTINNTSSKKKKLLYRLKTKLTPSD
ncbi:patellin-3-like [Lotus japonicus]|uniref:patellin-3-like n=1 Tax=Lotus japonicus TaxID=34305 RepID=UPI00258FFBF6|nr:patellin-3-like [Lotus japonicus]